MKCQNQIVVANVRGLRHHTMATKIKTLLHQYTDSPVRIACLLDTHLDANNEHKLTHLWDGECYFNHGPDHKAGIAILTKDCVVTEFISNGCGRFALLRTDLKLVSFLSLLCTLRLTTRNHVRIFFGKSKV